MMLNCLYFVYFAFLISNGALGSVVYTSQSLQHHRSMSDLVLLGRPTSVLGGKVEAKKCGAVVFKVVKVLAIETEDVFVEENVTVTSSIENIPSENLNEDFLYILFLKKAKVINSVTSYSIVSAIKLDDHSDQISKGDRYSDEIKLSATFENIQSLRRRRSIKTKKKLSSKADRKSIFLALQNKFRVNKVQKPKNRKSFQNKNKIKITNKLVRKRKNETTSNPTGPPSPTKSAFALNPKRLIFPSQQLRKKISPTRNTIANKFRLPPQTVDRQSRLLYPTRRVVLRKLPRPFPTRKFRFKKKKLFKFSKPSAKILKFLRRKRLLMEQTLSRWRARASKMSKLTLPTRMTPIEKSKLLADQFIHVSKKKANAGYTGRIAGCPTLDGIFRLTELFRNGFHGLVYIPPLQTPLTNGWIVQLNFNIPVKNVSSKSTRRVRCGSNSKQHCLVPTNIHSKILKYHDLKLLISGNFSGLRGFVQSRVKLMGICKGSRDYSEERPPIVEESSSSGSSPTSPSKVLEPTLRSAPLQTTSPSHRCQSSSPNGIPTAGGNIIPNWNTSTSDRYKVDYNELLHKSILFYEAQRSGRLPTTNRIPWRGDSDLKDGCPIHVDLTGGWYNSGGNVKSTPLIAFTTTLLAWGAIDYRGAYIEAGEVDRMMAQIQWATDYLLKCQISPSTLVVQIGDYMTSSQSWSRPSSSNPSSRTIHRSHFTKPAADVAGETAAALAAASILFNQSDSDYARKCLAAAEKAYEFGSRYPGRYRFTPRDSAFWYNYNHDYRDEMTWGALWLYRATGKEDYLTASKDGFRNMKHRPRLFSMRQKYQASAILLAKLTNESYYVGLGSDYIQWFIKEATRKSGGDLIRPVNTNMYLANAAFLALQAAKVNGTFEVINQTIALVEKQMETLVGISGQGYVVGVGKKSPKTAYHRGSSCPRFPYHCSRLILRRNRSNPNILYGALVSGSYKLRRYLDIPGNYFQNNVRIDYNAGFQSLAAAVVWLRAQVNSNQHCC